MYVVVWFYDIWDIFMVGINFFNLVMGICFCGLWKECKNCKELEFVKILCY